MHENGKVRLSKSKVNIPCNGDSRGITWLLFKLEIYLFKQNKESSLCSPREIVTKDDMFYIFLPYTSGCSQDYYPRGGAGGSLLNESKADFWLTWLIARDESEFLFQTCQFACSIAREK